MDGGKERGTEGGTGGRADAGGMAANKTRTPHRDVGKKHVNIIGLVSAMSRNIPEPNIKNFKKMTPERTSVYIYKASSLSSPPEVT